MCGNCFPCCAFVRAEVGDDGRDCGHELVASGSETELGFEIGAGVEIVAKRAKGLLRRPGGVEDRYMGTIDLSVLSAIRPPKKN